MIEIEEGETGREGESDSGSQYFLNSFASTQLGIKAIIPGLIPNPTELAAFRDKPVLQSINKAGTQENSTHIRKHMNMTDTACMQDAVWARLQEVAITWCKGFTLRVFIFSSGVFLFSQFPVFLFNIHLSLPLHLLQSCHALPICSS